MVTPRSVGRHVLQAVTGNATVDVDLAIVIPRHPLTLLIRAVAVLATASIQVHRLALRHMRAASGSLLTAGEWLGIVLPPTRHSLTPLRGTTAHNALAAPLTDSPPDIVGRSTALSRGSRQTGPHDGTCSGHQIPVPIVACASSQPLESTA